MPMVVDIFTHLHFKEGVCRSRKLNQEDGSVATSGLADGKSDGSIKNMTHTGFHRNDSSQGDASKLLHTLSSTEELYFAPHIIHLERTRYHLPLSLPH